MAGTAHQVPTGTLVVIEQSHVGIRRQLRKCVLVPSDLDALVYAIELPGDKLVD